MTRGTQSDRLVFVDRRWRVDAVGTLIFVAVFGLCILVFVRSVRPLSNRMLSLAAYGGFVCVWAVPMALFIRSGFTYRWFEADRNGLDIHEGWWGLVWKRQRIPREKIAKVECYDCQRQGVFASVTLSGLRVRLKDDSEVTLEESSRHGRCQQLAAGLRTAIGLPPTGSLEAT